MELRFNRLTPNIVIFKCIQRFLISMAVLPWLSLAFAQPAPKVTFLVPEPSGAKPFWEQMITVARAAAKDLNVDLRLVSSYSNSYSLKRDGLTALNDPDKADYFLTGYWASSSHFHLERAEQLSIRTFLVNSGMASGERAEMGRPRGKYKYWIGQVTPDDLQASYLLADMLIEKAKTADRSDDKVHLLGLGGWGNKSKMEEDRYGGLRKRINEQNDAVLNELILTGWSQDTAYTELRGKLKQNPNVTAIWSASDIMALGAIKAAEELGRKPGKDIFIGSFDWSLDGIRAVMDGKITATLGSHFLEGAKALILIHDYHYGIDFADDPGMEILTQMQPITKDNAEEYLDVLQKLDWHKVDFKRFSKKHNPKLKTYDLSLDALLDSMETDS